ncbi:hypothetical protein QTI66_02415 [Variovorax sp. J22R133]|uniref:hypothetical protein n=1 Tax=Variovorax brevis TaxID=3053503 RepID=UPI0025752F8D|nr:hypothetical protein [Variovorax sp. J22R133]MDM0110980.1 hypothetical protein [Variovorax sp. J22R133]
MLEPMIAATSTHGLEAGGQGWASHPCAMKAASLGALPIWAMESAVHSSGDDVLAHKGAMYVFDAVCANGRMAIAQL